MTVRFRSTTRFAAVLVAAFLAAGCTKPPVPFPTANAEPPVSPVNLQREEPPLLAVDLDGDKMPERLYYDQDKKRLMLAFTAAPVKDALLVDYYGEKPTVKVVDLGLGRPAIYTRVQVKEGWHEERIVVYNDQWGDLEAALPLVKSPLELDSEQLAMRKVAVKFWTTDQDRMIFEPRGGRLVFTRMELEGGYPEKHDRVANRFIQAVLGGFHEPALRAFGTESTQIPPGLSGAIAGIEPTSVAVHDKVGRADATVIGPRGLLANDVYTARMELRKVNAQWKVVEVTTVK